MMVPKIREAAVALQAVGYHRRTVCDHLLDEWQQAVRGGVWDATHPDPANGSAPRFPAAHPPMPPADWSPTPTPLNPPNERIPHFPFGRVPLATRTAHCTA